ncbi:uncharacterized protein LOC126997152 [Eriocheir sinensis]|uniref:uncharacterized protein LOC126997152 n=1 Tax=Eriocheir sinensis TaxID=95602 RepID=UPI0021C9C740|nr:uncharacterized protein LOC126997152 [Eriocheir sinensis]
MAAARSPRSLLLLAAIAAAGWSIARAACVQPPVTVIKDTTLLGRVLWRCLNLLFTFPNLQRAVYSQCENQSMIEEELTCAPPSDPTALSPCISDPPDVENAEKHILVDKVITAYTCIAGHSWLSLEEEQTSQCYKGEWTAIQDICDEECSLLRDCAEVNQMGIFEDDEYLVYPTGSPNDPKVLVQCDNSEVMADGGWLLAAQTEPGVNEGSTDTSTITEGFIGTNSRPPYFAGRNNLIAWNWNDTSPRSLTYMFKMKFTDDGSIHHATYTHVQVPREEPWDIILDAPYHGEAGDFFNNTNNATWSDGGELVKILQDSSPTWLGRPLEMLRLYIRPTYYDQAYSCPSLIGTDPSWQNIGGRVPLVRGPGTKIMYSCPGALRVKRVDTPGLQVPQDPNAMNTSGLLDTDTMLAMGGRTWSGISDVELTEETKNKEGFVQCVRNASGDLVWTASLELPCLLTCPDNYTKSRDGLSCIRIHHFGDDFGITSASLRVPTNATSLLLPDRYYYTASIR